MPPEHDHDHDHGHEHGHEHGGHHHEHVDVAQVPARRLLQALGISAIITVAQVVGGLLAHSLALLSDALHTLTDGIALLVSYAALRLSSRPASEQFTFGLKRAETLAAIVNSGVLIGISLWLLYEAVSRLLHPEPVTGWIMVAVASVGLVANITNTLLLRRGAEKNLNMRSAYLHVMSDGVVSLAVIVGGAAIIYDPALRWIDPVLTFLISVWLIYESWSIVWSGTRVMLMSAPDDVAVRDIQAALEALPDVRNVHHVHLWVLNDESIHLEAHVDIADDRRVSETSALGKQIEELLREKWSVTHVTLQFECGCCGEKPALVAERE
ncbi:MAG: cation diffusion facilitator family transporter [Opitutales bacterium]